MVKAKDLIVPGLILAGGYLLLRGGAAVAQNIQDAFSGFGGGISSILGGSTTGSQSPDQGTGPSPGPSIQPTPPYSPIPTGIGAVGPAIGNVGVGLGILGSGYGFGRYVAPRLARWFGSKIPSITDAGYGAGADAAVEAAGESTFGTEVGLFDLNSIFQTNRKYLNIPGRGQIPNPYYGKGVDITKSPGYRYGTEVVQGWNYILTGKEPISPGPSVAGHWEVGPYNRSGGIVGPTQSRGFRRGVGAR